MLILVSIALGTQALACPTQSVVLNAAADRVQTEYVLEAKGLEISNELRSWAQNGRFAATCSQPDVFAAQIEAELKVRDSHFRFELPRQTGGAETDSFAVWMATIPQENAGVREARLLDGQIGYLRITSWFPAANMAPKLKEAFAFIDGANSLILDLRGNRGGSGDMGGQVVKAISGNDYRSVLQLQSRKGPAQAEDAPAPEFSFPANKPVVVLINRTSASASEAVAFELQTSGRATVIGERSFGAAHLISDPFQLPQGFQISIPEARPVATSNGTSWERTGVKPDIAGGDDPLYTALRFLDKRERPAKHQ